MILCDVITTHPETEQKRERNKSNIAPSIRTINISSKSPVAYSSSKKVQVIVIFFLKKNNSDSFYLLESPHMKF